MPGKRSTMGEVAQLRAENDGLRAENKRLRARSSGTSSRHPVNVIRQSVATVFVVLAVLIVAASNLLFWFANTVVNQDQFVATTQPIIRDPIVEKTLALYTTNTIFRTVNVQQAVEQVLPPRAGFLAPQLTDQLEAKTQSTLQNIAAQPTFQRRWNDILANQHARFISAVARYSGNGTISLSDVYAQLTNRLQSTRLSFLAGTKLPPQAGNITLVTATWLPLVHAIVINLDTWRVFAILLFFVCMAAAVWPSRNRPRTLIIFGFGVILFMLATLLALELVQSSLTANVDQQYVAGVEQATQIAFHPLVLQTALIIVAAVLLIAITWVVSSGGYAAALRRQLESTVVGTLHDRLIGDRSNAFTRWMATYKRTLEAVAVIVLAVIVILARLTFTSLIIYIIVLGLVVLTIEVLSWRSN